MEQLPDKPVSQVSEALSIIKDVTDGTFGQFLVNKHQCESLEGRLRGIGVVLEQFEELPDGNSRANSHEDQVNYPAIDELLRVLKRAKDLLSEYRNTNAVIPSVLTSAENRKTFEEIHSELDTLKTVFYFEDYKYASESTKSAALTADANKDREELCPNLEGLETGMEPSNATAMSQIVETVKAVLSEKTALQGGAGVPGDILNIDPSLVEVKSEPVKRVSMRRSDREIKDGVLVRHARFLNCEFAVKEFKSDDPNWDRDELLKEVGFLMKLTHPHVVQFIAIAQNQERCLILMELMDGDLRNFIDKRREGLATGGRPFNSRDELSIIKQIAKGMYYLHEQQYVHGELKCSNILVRRKANIHVKISDLRSSQKLIPGAWDPERSKRNRARWAAPEVKEYYGNKPVVPTPELLMKADTYSFGMLCYEVVTGKLPFENIQGKALDTLIEAGEVKQKLPANLNADLQSLIESCWSIDPNDRLTFSEICYQLEIIDRRWLQSVIPRVRKIMCCGKEEKADPFQNEHVQDGSSAVQEMDSDWSDEFVRIQPTKLKIGRKIGSGAFGVVRKASWLGLKFAVKECRHAGQLEDLQTEMKLLMKLRHPSIVQLVGLSVKEAKTCYMVMELMKSNLRDLMVSRMSSSSKGVPFDLRDAVYIIQRIAQGMVFLHFRGVVHRDLKALNVLVPLDSNPIEVKISDFGLSQFIDQEDEKVKAGTTGWRAPELDSAKSMELIDLKAADVFSFAVTCFEILTGKPPFSHGVKIGEFRKQLNRGVRPQLPSDLHSDLKKLVEDCWDGEPKKRPTFIRICQALDKIYEGL